MNIIKTRLLRALEHTVVKSAIEQSRLNGQFFQYVSILLEPLPFKPESAFPGMGRTSPASLLVDAGSAAHLLILLCQEPVDGAAGALPALGADMPVLASLEEVVQKVAKEAAAKIITQELGNRMAVGPAVPPEAPSRQRGMLPAEATLLLQGRSQQQEPVEDMLLFNEAAAEIFQLLLEEEQQEKRLGQDTAPGWSSMRWATLSMRLLAMRHQFSLREGKCLLAICRKESLSLAEEQLVELILLGDPLWISTFPWLKRRCMQLLAQRLEENLPAETTRHSKIGVAPGTSLGSKSIAERRSHQDGVVVSSLYSRRNFEVPVGSSRTMQELPPLYHASIRAFYTHSADALPPPPGLCRSEDEDEDEDD